MEGHPKAQLKQIAEQLLQTIGEKPSREGLRHTPQRFSESFSYLVSGYQMDPFEQIRDALFEDGSTEMILVNNVDVFSLCEHHLLPFFGKAHVAYIPKGKIIGLSKIPRIVATFARRLQIQERLTQQIADALFKILQPEGVAVSIEATHLCMMMRGVHQQQSTTLTHSLVGVFKDNPARRQEFFQVLRKS